MGDDSPEARDIEHAALWLWSAPARTRARVAADAGRSDAAPAIAWGTVVEAWDHPPSWMDVPDVDLQPELIRRIQTAMASATSKALAAGQALDRALRTAFDAAERAMAEVKSGARATLFAGSGACAASVLVTATAAAIGWIGTARVHRIRAGRVELLTADHTALGAETGTGRPALSAGLRRVLGQTPVRFLGSGGELGAEVCAIDVRPGDAFVLGSAALGDLAAAALPDGGSSAHQLACALLQAAAPACAGHPVGVAVLRTSAPATSVVTIPAAWVVDPDAGPRRVEARAGTFPECSVDGLPVLVVWGSRDQSDDRHAPAAVLDAFRAAAGPGAAVVVSWPAGKDGWLRVDATAAAGRRRAALVAAAVIQASWGWDESERIRVEDGEGALLVAVQWTGDVNAFHARVVDDGEA
jgi:hypothetical protein